MNAYLIAYLIGVVLIIVAEMFALIRRVDYWTFSEWAQRTMMVIFAFGVLVGHIVFAPKEPIYTVQSSIVIAIMGVIFSLMIGRGVDAGYDPSKDVNQYRVARMVVLIIGIVVGWTVWPLP